jgi:PAS domain S-box-containing protein
MVTVFPPAKVEVDSSRRYVDANDAACELLGYSRQELLTKTIDDISYPSGAHVDPLFQRFQQDGSMAGIFALRRKSGEGIMVRFESRIVNGRALATWTHYAPVEEPVESELV